MINEDGYLCNDNGLPWETEEGDYIPAICQKCGGEIGVFLMGEPVFLCKDCRHYYGTVKFKGED